MINIDQIKREIKDATPHMLEALGVKKSRGRWWCPKCQTGDNHKTPDMTVSAKTGSIKCHRCGWTGDCISLYMETRNVGFLDALEAMSKGKFKGASNYAKIAPKVAVEKPRKYYESSRDALTAIESMLDGYTFTKAWQYQEMDGTPFMYVARFDGKDGKEYRPITRDEKGWYIGRSRQKLPLYNLPAITNSFDEVVWLGEGEKVADAMIGAGLLGTCCAGGAMAVENSDWEPLRNRKIICLPDADKAGEQFALDVQKKLPQTIIMRLPGLKPKEDFYDWIQTRRDKTKEQMLAELREIWKEQR